MYPYTQNTGSLLAVIKAIGSHGVPSKFTTKELPIWGFKSSNDRNISNVLKFIGFLDPSGVPQEGWKRARTDAPAAVAAGLRSGYSELFKTFPDAHRKDGEALTNFFKAKTTVGDAVVKQMVATFRALAQFGDFDSAQEDVSDEDERGLIGSPAPLRQANTLAKSTGFTNSQGMTINLNIELSVPTDTTGEVYEKFFASMKKHLLDV